MREFLQSNPLYAAGAVFGALLLLFVAWKLVKGAVRVALMLVLLALVAAAVVWLGRSGASAG